MSTRRHVIVEVPWVVYENWPGRVTVPGETAIANEAILTEITQAIGDGECRPRPPVGRGARLR